MKGLIKWLPVCVVGIGIVAYANSFGGPFIFDDCEVVTNAPGIHRVFPLPATGRLLYHLSFRLNYAIGGFNPADYHLVNLLVHIGAGLILYGVLRRTFALPSLNTRYGPAAPWLAVTCACIWIAHPVQTESVTYISQRSESMMGLLFLLTFYCFVRATGSVHKRAWYNASIAACAIGMAAKEVMAAAPILLVLYDYIFVSGSIRELLRRRWKVHAATLATWGILFFLWMLSMADNALAGKHMVARMSPLTYLATEFGVITHYLRLTLWPNPLCLDYAWPAAESVGQVLPGALFIIALGIMTMYGLLKRAPLAFLGAWFFFILAPTSSFVPLDDPAFEHRMYLPLVASIVLTVCAAHHLLNVTFAAIATPGKCRVVLRIAIVIVTLGLLSCLTLARNTDYQSEDAMWRSTVAARPDNLRAHLSLAVASLQHGRHAEAENSLRHVLDRLPTTDDSSGLDLTVRAKAHDALGVLRYREGQYTAAVTQFRQALTAAWQHVNARNNLGLALKKLGRTDEAVGEWYRTLSIEPDNAAAHYNLATSLAQQQHYDRAIEHLEDVVLVRPNMIGARLDLAWILATCEQPALRDGHKALHLAEDARRRLKIESVRVLDVLGAANAELRRFDLAIQYAQAALDLGRSRNMSGLELIERRIDLYGKGVAFTDVGGPE